VLYSDWLSPFTLAGGNVDKSFTEPNTPFNCRRFYTVKVNNLDSYLASATVLVYLKDGGSVYTLPFTNVPASTAYLYTTKKEPLDTQASFRFDLARGSASSSLECDNIISKVLDAQILFRYVIIPGTQLVTPQSLGSNSSLKNLSYAEIQQRFGLKD